MRYAAFSALRAITGVANRSQLHSLLIKLRLLQDVSTDEVRNLTFGIMILFFSHNNYEHKN